LTASFSNAWAEMPKPRRQVAIVIRIGNESVCYKRYNAQLKALLELSSGLKMKVFIIKDIIRDGQSFFQPESSRLPIQSTTYMKGYTLLTSFLPQLSKRSWNEIVDDRSLINP
jgi:hypothetical protein